MKTAKMIASLIRFVGRDAVLTKNDVSTKFKTYCNPICEKSASSTRLENGSLSPQKFLVICPSDTNTPKLEEGDVFYCGETPYLIDASQILYFLDDAAYQWAIAVMAQEDLL